MCVLLHIYDLSLLDNLELICSRVVLLVTFG